MMPEDFEDFDGIGKSFFYKEQTPEQRESQRLSLHLQGKEEGIVEKIKAIQHFLDNKDLERQRRVEVSSGLYISGDGFLIARSSQGNPETVYSLTPREYYCAVRGLKIYD